MINSNDSLKYLQQIRDIANNAITSARNVRNKQEEKDQEDDYQSIFKKMQQEQQDWDAKMKELDVAQKKIQAMDRFWTGKNK